MKKILATISLIGILIFSSLVFSSPQQTQAATTPLTCTVITYDLWPNSKDSKTQGQVSKLQNFLIAEGYLHASPTGNLGPLTELALQQFQKAQGIVSSGTYISTGYGATGPKTRAAIKNISCNGGTGASTSVSTLPLGCNPGYKFSTLTGQPCTTSLVSNTPTNGNQNPLTFVSQNIGGSSTSGNTSQTQTQIQTQTQTQTQNFPAGTILVPGSGFNGATAQPATIGNSSQAGYTAKAIARWDVVPYQTFTGNFNVGVVAFHINNIDHVAFSVNGGPWTNVSQMSTNPQTNVNEYWATVRASDFQDGQIELRAIAYPTVGIPRVLDSLFLDANAKGTITSPTMWVSTTGSDSTGDGSQTKPYASLLAAAIAAPPGATVYLGAGSYPIFQRGTGYRAAENQWLNFEPAPGVSSSAVTVSVPTASSMRVDKLAFHNLNLDMTAGQPFTNDTQGGLASVWLDNVNVFGSLTDGASLSQFQPNFAGNVYINDSKLHDIAYDPLTFTNLVRNSQIYNSYAHGANDPLLMINTTITNIQSRPSINDHVDGIFWFDPNTDENSIVYGVTMTGINGLTIFSDQPGSNLAVINTTASSVGDGPGGAVQFGKGLYSNVINHLLFDHLTLSDQRFVFVDDTSSTQWSNSIIRNCVAVSVFASNPANLIRNCETPSGTPIPDFGGGINQTPIIQTSTSTSPTGTTTSPTSSGPIAKWTMDSSTISGNSLQDSSGNSNNGTLVNNPTSMTGQIAQALSFSGSNYVTFPAIQLTAPYTISAWVNPGVSASGYRSVVSNNSGNGLYLFGYNNQVCFYSNQCALSNSGLSTNSWQHIVITIDASNNLTFYVNGVANGTSQAINIPVNRIAGDDYNENFVGGIDDVRIYNRALSSSEISQLYAGTLSLNTQKSTNSSNPTNLNTSNLANVLNSTLNLLPHAIPGTSYYNSLMNTLSSTLHALGIK